MSEHDIVATALSRLCLPPMRTDKPIIVVAAGGRAETGRFFDVLSEFFPLVYVARRIADELSKELLADLCKRLGDDGVCPFIEAGDVHQSHFGNLNSLGLALHLVWVADTSKGQMNRAGNDRVEWLKSAMSLSDFHLVDSSEDLYPQAFSLPFLPGERR